MRRSALLTQAPAIAVISDEGAAQKANQDAYLYLRVGPGQSEQWEAHPEQSLYVAGVADGVTGQAAGDYASAIAAKTIHAALCQQDPGLAVPQRLQEACLAANQAIRQAAAQNPEQRGMSTTLVLAVVAQWQLYLAHLGDSRAYLIRGRAIHQLTLDHTWVQEAVDVGRLSAAEAQQHPNRHTLTKHLGTPLGLALDTDIYLPGVNWGRARRRPRPMLPLQAGDAILLCSDGVTDKISPSEIAQIVSANKSAPQFAVTTLVQQALARQEGDNITAVLMMMPGRSMGLSIPAAFTAEKLYPLRYALLSLLLLLVLWLALGSNPFGAAEIATRSTTALQQAVAPAISTPSPAPPTLVPITVLTDSTVSSGTTGIEAAPASAFRAATVTAISPTLANNSAHTTALRMANALTPTLVSLPPTPTATNATTTPTVRPTATRVALTPAAPDSPPPLPSPTAADQQPALTPVAAVDNACAGCTVTLNEPLDPLLYGRRTFRWTPAFDPGGQYLFELVFWEDGQSAMQHGRSPVGAKAETSITVDLDRAAATLGLRTELTYKWGVLLVDARDVRKRIRQLSPEQPFQLQLSADGAGAD